MARRSNALERMLGYQPAKVRGSRGHKALQSQADYSGAAKGAYSSGKEIAGVGAGAAMRTGSRSLNQAINIMSGDINPKEIIKIAIIFAILLCLTIWVINFARGIVVGMEQFSCNLGNSGCEWALFGQDISGGHMCQQCDPTASNTVIHTITWAWDAEWYARMMLYICLALVVGLLLYQYTIWLLNKLLHVDREIAKFDDWIYGFRWEGTAEQAIEQNL